MQTNQLTFISLFAGIGGFDLGFERAGMRCVAQVEKDPFCRKVLAKHWPNVERFEDVKEVGKHNLPPADVICGGFPCQPHSVAGKRKGSADDRDLWPEYRRIIAEINPAFVVGENVPGIRTTILDSVLSDLENLNYSWQSFIIPACAVDAPHRRDRVFIVAHANGVNGRAGAGGQNGPQAGNNCKIIPNANNTRLAKRESQRSDAQQKQPAFVRICHENGIETMAYANGEQAQRATIAREQRHTWQPEPGVGRVANGVPNRVDRLRSLGNAVVPQVAEFIGQLVVRHHLTMPIVPTAET